MGIGRPPEAFVDVAIHQASWPAPGSNLRRGLRSEEARVADDKNKPSAGPQYALDGAQRRCEVRGVHQAELPWDPVEGLVCPRRYPLRLRNPIRDRSQRLR